MPAETSGIGAIQVPIGVEAPARRPVSPIGHFGSGLCRVQRSRWRACISVTWDDHSALGPAVASGSESSDGVPQSYLMYLKRGSSGVPSSAPSGSGRQLMVSSILRASWKSLSVMPLAEWVTSLTITKA